jgi:hypothetical protein
VVHHDLPTTYGHDSFLLAEDLQTPLIAAFLDDVYRDVRGGR